MTQRVYTLLIVWLIPGLLLVGVAGVAVKISAAPSEGTAIDRLLPRSPGDVWVYRDEVDGVAAGLATVRVVGRGLLVGAGAVDVIQSHYDHLFGGAPATLTDYVGTRGNGYVEFGFNVNSQFTSLSPPEPMYTVPLRPGRTFDYHGMSGTNTLRMTAKIGAVKTVDVGGHHLSGCPEFAIDETQTSATGSASITMQRTTMCPGVGIVANDLLTGSGKHLIETLIGFRSRATSLGDVAPDPPATTPPYAPHAWSDTTNRGLLLSPTGGPGVLLTAEDDGSVTATDTATGIVRWRQAVAGLAVAPPVLAGEVVVVGVTDKTVLGLDAVTGKTLWITTLADVLAAQPAVAGDIAVVVTENRQVRGMHVRDGTTAWGPIGFGPVSGPAVLAGGVAVLADTSGNLLGLRPSDGSTSWRASSGAPASPLGVAGDTVVYGDVFGNVVAWSAAGHHRWSRAMGVNIVLAPTGSGSVVVVATGDRRLDGLDVGSGHRRWSAKVPADIGWAPVSTGDTVAVLTVDARLRRFRLTDGTTGTPSTANTDATQVTAPVDLATPTGGPTVVSVGPSVVDGAVVTAVHSTTAGLLTTISAFPADGSRPLRLDATVRSLPVAPISPPVFTADGSMVYAGIDHSVRVSPTHGPVRKLDQSTGRVFFSTLSGDLVIAQHDNDLVGLPIAGGPAVWRLPVGPPTPDSGVAIVGSTAVAGVPGVGLVSVDTRSGRPLWIHPVPESTGASPPLAASDGSVIWAVGGLTDVDARSGAVRWVIPGFTAFAPVAEYRGVVAAVGFLADGTTSLVVVDLATGRIRWKKPLGVAVFAGPAIGAGMVVAPDDGGVVHAFDLQTGAERWAFPAGPLGGSPAIVGTHAVIDMVGTRENAQQRGRGVVVLDAATGAWQASLETPGPGPGPGSNAFSATADGEVVVPTSVVSNAVFLIHLGGSS